MSEYCNDKCLTCYRYKQYESCYKCKWFYAVYGEFSSELIDLYLPASPRQGKEA